MDYSKMDLDSLTREEEKLNAKYSRIEKECLQQGLPFDEFCKKAEKVAEELYFIDKYKRLKQDPIVEYGKEWKGDLYTIAAFRKDVNDGLISDDDGYGNYATETSKSNVIVKPSDFKENLIRDDFSHIIWFSK